MQIQDFKAIVTTFADPGTDIEFERDQILISVNGDLIQARISMRSGDVFIDVDGAVLPANKWILERLAKLRLLATRLRDTVPRTEHFVPPSATLLPTLSSSPSEDVLRTENALDATLKELDAPSPLETTVLYITSDAGEGKTSLINELARKQAQRFTDNQSDWVLVPIPLGGRHFLRFDDITVGALQNRYRFPFLHYTSFLALVRMGVIVPAFDGFEEMFVENSSGEALSAMGILVNSLESQGSMLLAARKAYFEFENLKSQEKLFDPIRKLSVGFAKLELLRWERKHFLDYCRNRQIQAATELYNRASERLGANHALLTRAVLVKRLVDVAVSTNDQDALFELLHKSGSDFFSVFVRSIIEREANDKWLDRSGENDVGCPLLSIDEHCELLAQIAIAMWESQLDFIKRDNLEFVADYFCETTRKTAFQGQQIRERVRGHALLVPSANANGALAFDHDEFRMFFLGEGIGQLIRFTEANSKTDVYRLLRKGPLPTQTRLAAILSLERNSSNERQGIAAGLLDVCNMDSHASHAHENASSLLLSALSGCDVIGFQISGLAFGVDCLRDKKLKGIAFTDCYFAATSLELATLDSCSFSHCRFTQIRLHGSTAIEGTSLSDCSIDSISDADRGVETWDPNDIKKGLMHAGFDIPNVSEDDITEEVSEDDFDETVGCVTKLVRYFMRSTHISESVMLMKLGGRGQGFIDSALPQLLTHGVLEEIHNYGSGNQRRFRLAVPLEDINKASSEHASSFQDFLQCFHSASN